MKNQEILLVEDNLDDQELIRIALEEGHVANELVIVNDGAQALDYLFGMGNYTGRDISKKPQVVLLDLKLPKLTGLEVLERMRADLRTALIPVVILTSSNEEEDIVASYNLGANSYIRKPVDFNHFLEVVKRLGCYWLILNHKPPNN